jgi:ribonuclease HI
MEPISNLKKVKLFIQGACPSGKIGVAGWACRLVCDGVTADMSGCDPESSENRMSLRGATEGFRALKQRCLVTAYTNSEYLYKGITNWLPKWKTNGWQTETGQVKNQALWQELGNEAARHVVRWRALTSESPDFAELQDCAKLALEAATQQSSSPLTRKPSQGASANEGSAAAEQIPA